MTEDKNTKTLQNLIVMFWKEREKVKLLHRRVDWLYIVVWILVVYELCKMIF